MKKFILSIIVILSPVAVYAAWVLQTTNSGQGAPAIWRNSSTGQVYYGPYPPAVNTFTNTPTFTPTNTVTPYPGTFTGTPTNSSILGIGAGINISTATRQTYLGASTGKFHTSGDENTFIGDSIASINTSTGNQNVIVGSSSAQSMTTGFDNTFLGAHCGLFFTSGQDNTFGGEGSGAFSTTASDNSLYGFHSGLNLSSGDHNTGMGESSLLSVGTGQRNTALGYGTDAGVSNYSDSVLIGYTIGSDVTTGDQLRIGNRFGAIISADMLAASVSIQGSLKATSYQVGATPTPGYMLTPGVIPYGAPVTFNNGLATGVGSTPTPSIQNGSVTLTALTPVSVSDTNASTSARMVLEPPFSNTPIAMNYGTTCVSGGCTAISSASITCGYTIHN